jgi:hypothetical protein
MRDTGIPARRAKDGEERVFALECSSRTVPNNKISQCACFTKVGPGVLYQV